MKIDAAPLKQDVEAFLKLTGMAESTFGRYGMNDSGFVTRLASTQDTRHDTAVKAREFMVRVLADTKASENKRFRSAMQQWIDEHPKPTPPKAKPAKAALPVDAKKPEPEPAIAEPHTETFVASPQAAMPPPQPLPPLSVQNKRIEAAKERQCEAAPQKPVSVTLGAQLQEVALADDIKDAVQVLKRRWPSLWRQICQLAQQKNERPIPVMISMLEAQVEGAIQ